MKAHAALLIALADIGKVWPVMRVTAALTELADTALRAALRFLHERRDAARESSTRADKARPEIGSGYFVLAMGKMGAFELNYSSDIDLIVLFDPEVSALPPGTEAAAAHVRLTRGLVKLLQERTVRRLCVPRRLAAASRSGFDPDRALDAQRARLLRASRPELGTLGDDQGAALRRRYRGRGGVPPSAVARSCGGNTWISPPSRTSTR